MKILLADHHAQPLPPVESELQEAGHEVVRTRHLAETLAHLESAAPDLLVLSPLTPAVDGFEVRGVTERLPSEPRPRLLMAAEHASDLIPITRNPACPVDDFLLQPVRPAELVHRIELNLSRMQLVDELQRTNQTLVQETITDFKTGLYNDRFFFQRLTEEVGRSQRHGLAVALVLLDFDDFKTINDEFDHVFGDFVLMAFARKLRTVVRHIDIPARLGGDEFALLLPNTDLEEAALFANRLRGAVSDHAFENQGRSTRLCLSMGVDSIQGDNRVEPEEFLRRADQALLEAKRRGKNRICLFPELNARARSASA